MDGQGQGTGVPPSMPAESKAADSLLEELKAFAGRLAAFGLGEETGRLLKDAAAKRPAAARPGPRPTP